MFFSPQRTPRTQSLLILLFLCALGVLGGESIPELPPKSVFPAAAPRYPNLWFYIDTRQAPTYEAAVKRVTEHLRQTMRLREYRQGLSNAEGCDFEARIEHLQPWEDPAHRALQHSHAFHIRYYYTSLQQKNLHRVGDYWRFAASVHYEVEHTNPNHADVEACPICGRTGEYAGLTGNLVEMVHDPLGLELVLTGKIRGQAVRHEDFDERPVAGIGALGQSQILAGGKEDRNTLRIGIVRIK
jgi:hypothetical protein